ncbi:MAG: response regulator [Oscillospiraceae bacterium]|nr:response regulator [Oscillospiraceae bacterium]
MQKIVFIVDDNDVNLITAEEALSEHYRVYTLPSAKAMFDFLEKVTPDLILLDVVMPEMSGIDAMNILKKNERYAGIPVIFLTGRTDPKTETSCLEAGSVDFISKPFSKSVLLNRIKLHLRIEDIICDRTENLKKLKDSIISVLANMVESRDSVTGQHIERTTAYIKILLEIMLENKLYLDEIQEWDLDTVVSSARLHDIGKIAISDLILNKPGRLTKEEFDIIKTHVVEGEKIIESIIHESGDEAFLSNAKLFAGYHHERWDGSGYPYGISGSEIPLHGRIMALVDVYDALTSVRPYKPAFPHDKAIEEIANSSGSHFDPVITDIFLQNSERFRDVG